MSSFRLITLCVLGLAFVSASDTPNCQNCRFEGEYVCSSNNVTYPSACHARCVDDDSFEDGACQLECECLDEHKPVCGKNGKTYQNACFARCNQVAVDTNIDGACKCNCSNEYKPVCGKDQVTYKNHCFAECKGVGVLYLRRCEEYPQIRDYPTRSRPSPQLPIMRNRNLDQLTPE